MTNLTKLISISSPPILPTAPSLERIAQSFGTNLSNTFGKLLIKNGFYSFEGALHVLSDAGTQDEEGLLEWNIDATWRKNYCGMASNGTFFAEDVFGNQFCVDDKERVTLFDAETAKHEPIASSIEEWASVILSDYNLWTGYRLAHEWQTKNRAIPRGARLLPKRPFVLGGDYDAANLYACKAADGMRLRGDMAVQLKDVPDGQRVALKVTT